MRLLADLRAGTQPRVRADQSAGANVRALQVTKGADHCFRLYRHTSAEDDVGLDHDARRDLSIP